MTTLRPVGPQPSAVLATKYARALDIAAVIVVAGWHAAGAGSLLVGHLGSYRSEALQIGAWLAVALIITAGAILLLRGSYGRWTAWALAGGALAISTAVALACPPGQMLATNWAWGTAGWVGVLVLLRRPIAELGVFLFLETLATFCVLAHDGLHRQSLAAFITVLAGSIGIQLAVAVAARALNVPARQAAEATTRQADASAARAVADRVRASRQARWSALHDTVEPLLRNLAAGTADPGDPEVQRRCAVEAARLRRLFAESDDTPDALIHELYACADVAQRRGVAVDIETAAAAPAVPPEVRHAITDLAIAVFVTVVSQVRVTITGTGDGLIVSFVSDSPADPDLPAVLDEVVIDSQRDQQSLWVEARWNTP